MNGKYLPVLPPIAAFVMALTGCGGSNVTISPDFNRTELRVPSLKRENVRIVDVIDARKKPTGQIGTARVGLFNRQVPYQWNGSTGEIVRRMLDSLLVMHTDRERYLPVTVAIDMFEVGERMAALSEEGYFAGAFRFIYPVTADSIGSQSVFVKRSSSGMDVTNSLEKLIYDGMAESAKLFVEGTLDKQKGFEAAADSLPAMKKQTAAAAAPKIERAASTKRDSSYIAPKSPDSNELSFAYSAGDKVKTGIRATYSYLSEKENGRMKWGLGVSLTYFDVDNKKDYYTGTFLNYGGRLIGRYFLSEARTSLYAGFSIGLAGGTERINYGSAQSASFFFGPDFEETIGVSFNRKFMLEIGSFQLVYFGSKLLPSDVGVAGGFSVEL